MCRCRCSVQASNQTLSKGKAPTWASWQLLHWPTQVQNHLLTSAFAASHAQRLHAAWLQPSIACWAAQFLMHRKRHLTTSRHQSKIISVMSATCDHLGIQLAIRKAHLTPSTTARWCEAPWKQNGLRVRQAKWMDYKSQCLSENSAFIIHPTRPCFYEPFQLQDKAKRGGI